MNTYYSFYNEVLTEAEALTLIKARLGECSGDIALDLEYIKSLNALNRPPTPAERRIKRRDHGFEMMKQLVNEQNHSQES